MRKLVGQPISLIKESALWIKYTRNYCCIFTSASMLTLILWSFFGLSFFCFKSFYSLLYVTPPTFWLAMCLFCLADFPIPPTLRFHILTSAPDLTPTFVRLDTFLVKGKVLLSYWFSSFPSLYCMCN